MADCRSVDCRAASGSAGSVSSWSTKKKPNSKQVGGRVISRTIRRKKDIVKHSRANQSVCSNRSLIVVKGK